MRFRKLRIAWSVVWGIACVLLIALWVRSYWWPLIIASEQWKTDFVVIRGHYYSGAGLGWSGEHKHDIVIPISNDNSIEIHDLWDPHGGGAYVYFSQKRIAIWPFMTGAIAIAASASVAPWLRQLGLRYSLRTLIIATTLVAVVLGAIVWSLR